MSNKSTIDDKPLRSTPGDFDRFIKSALWYDIRETVKDRVELLQEQLISATDHAEMRNIQGQMKAWKEMLGLPPYLKSCAHRETSVNQKELELD